MGGWGGAVVVVMDNIQAAGFFVHVGIMTLHSVQEWQHHTCRLLVMHASRSRWASPTRANATGASGIVRFWCLRLLRVCMPVWVNAW